MSNMIFYPQGVNPQGLQKVYYCGHPSDFDRCFEIVRKDIFGAVQDRTFVLCYDRSPEEPPDENFYVDLGRMKMFVVPVTYRFLTTPSRARDVEIPFALENHIPVLPLLQDRPDASVLEAFTKVFGDLQFLYKYDEDSTALPYEEKLKKYLSARILDDETAEKVRAAFDAYIFLSYRKKDRRYAQELMRLIHRNEFCRDLAIWYDEFLTPGEDFNDNIKAALDKSVLFALAVTPNLINEKNYVMTVEYPEAKDAKKPILSAEMVATDAAVLKDCYKDIPEAVNAHDGPALSAELLRQLEGVALMANDTDPVHNFFIGLAYLSGIDVEVDHARALSLITSAAEANLPEAMDKLATMYHDGDGVARDYEQVVFWKKKLVAYYKDAFAKSGGELEAVYYKSALWSLGDVYTEMYRSEDALGCWTEFYDFCKGLSERTKTPWVLRNLAVACGKLGKVAVAQADMDRAERYYCEAREILESDSSEEVSYLQDLTVDYHDLGELYTLRCYPQKADENLRKALACSERVAKQLHTESSWIDWGICYGQLGKLRLQYGDLDGAGFYFAQEMNVFAQVREWNETPQLFWNMATCCSLLSDVFSREKDFKKAEEYLRKSISLFEGQDFTETPQGKFNFALKQQNLGNILFAQKDYSSAETCYLQGLALWQSLAEGNDTPSILRELAVSYDALGYLKTQQKQMPQAQAYYGKCIPLMIEVVKKHPTEKYANDCATFCYRSAVCLPGEGRKMVLRQAAELWNDLAVNFPKNPNYPRNRDSCFDLLKKIEQIEAACKEE